ncbi:MAG: dephospho-CoA kinase [Actinomycetota bacterium]|nr:dephospho-CoA kinase [Actinomycetota bacterium]
MLRVGLTGGIGAGKSAVAARLAELGAVVVDADVLAREAVEPGSAGLAEVVETFGPEVLNDTGSLDRAAMARRVFVDPAARARLEAIVHPRVRRRAAQIEAAAGPAAVVVHDIPLLVETGQADRFDVVVVVDVPPDVQLRRLVRQRGMSEDEARDRIAAQARREQRLAAADVVIDNTGTCEDLRHRVTEVFEQLRSSALRRAASPGSDGP